MGLIIITKKGHPGNSTSKKDLILDLLIYQAIMVLSERLTNKMLRRIFNIVYICSQFNIHIVSKFFV